jgi:nitrite reductase (NADH) large subunit
MAVVTRFKCEVCGYIHEGDAPPDTCPVCGVGPEMFTPYAEPRPEPPAFAAQRWRCTICNEILTADAPPQTCPVCSADASWFVAYEEKETRVESDAGPERIVIVGGGVAGLSAAESARQHAPDAAVTLIHKEPDPPYNRLNLTRYLAGEVKASELPLRSAAWYAERRIDLVAGDVVRVDRQGRLIELRSGTMVGFDKLVLANGSHPFVPPLMGAARGGVLSLRTKAHAEQILERARPGTHCVVLGGGLLGLETAGALARRGADVTVLEGFAWLLPRQLAQPGGVLLRERIEALGVEVRCNARAAEIVGDEDARALRLADESELAADLVVLATGVRPNSHLARQCGLAVKGGVVVDDQMRTSDEDIFAAGDVSEHRGIVYGLWPAALLQGRVAGTNAAGGESNFAGIPPATQLKVLDIPVFSIGQFMPTDGGYQVLERQAGGTYQRVVCRDGTLVGANLVGDTALAGPIREAVQSGLQVAEAAQLLRDLLPDIDGARPTAPA